jgi:uncharacterized membrane protein
VFKETFPHTLNVWTHVAFGTMALVLGLVPLLVRKGGPAHVRAGRWFLACLAAVLATAVLGVVVFAFRAFLAVITLLTAYEAYSGWRAMRNKGSGPQLQDGVVAGLALVAALLFVGYIRSVAFPWSGAVVYSTLGALVTVAVYDLARFRFPARWLARTWFPEHVVKMLGAYSGVVSAFAGTVLPSWQPYSQLAPSVLAFVAMGGFLLGCRSAAGRDVRAVTAA